MDVLGREPEQRTHADEVERQRRILELLFEACTESFEVRLLVLDTLEAMGDLDGAETAALDLSSHCADEVMTWRRLQLYYASTGDRYMEMTTGERFLRMRDEALEEARREAERAAEED